MSRHAILCSALLLATPPACAERSATEETPAAQPTASADPQGAVLERIDALVRDARFAEAEKLAVELPSEVVAAQVAASEGHVQLLYAGVHLRRTPWRLDLLEPILLHGDNGAPVVHALCRPPPTSRPAMPTLTWVERPDPPIDLLDRVASTTTVAETRCEALSCLADWRMPRAAKLARRAHVFSETRACALRVLGRVGDEEDVPTLIEHLDSADERVRKAAIDGLGALPYEAARQALRTFVVQADERGESYLAEGARRAWLDHPLRTSRPGVAGRFLPDRVTAVMRALGRGDYATLAGTVHPELGLRLGWYGALTDNRFSAMEVRALATDGRRLSWGSGDGDEQDYLATAASFIDTILEPRRFRAPDRIGYGEWVIGDAHRAPGWSPDELAWEFPDSLFAQLVLDAESEQNPGMWQVLTLVFAPHEADWKLVALVHDGWTI